MNGRLLSLASSSSMPLRRFAKSEIVPSNKDRFLRKETLQGFVHDEASAFFGGLAGNAGLDVYKRQWYERLYHDYTGYWCG